MPKKDTTKAVVQRKKDKQKENAQKGINYLFVIAIDAYQYCPKLYNCTKDAIDLIEVLTTQYSFDKQHIKTLFNEKATEGNIFKEFRNLAQNVTVADNLVIYFSGHGEYDKVFDEGYWIPVDAQLGAYEDYVPNSKIKTVLNAIHAKHTFLISDSCFSGSLFTQFKSASVAERLEHDPSRWGLTAGRNEVVSDGSQGDHSPFADSLIYHLKNNKKALGVATLCNRVIENVVASAEQTPRGEPLKVKGHRGGQFFFHPKEAFLEKPKTDTKQGNILYQIPNQLEVNQDTKCIVRIAFEKTILLKELEDTTEITIKSIRISNLMEVDLLDPLMMDTFQIRSITQKEQFIDKEDFTQWLFYIKAKKEGKFPLLLKVTVIEMLYGKERRREIILEETIQVVAKLTQSITPQFKNAGYALSFSEAVIISMPAPAKPNVVASGGNVKPSPVFAPKPSKLNPEEDSVSPKYKPKTRRKRNIYKIMGGIAAALLFVFSGNVFMNRYIGNKSPLTPSPIEEPINKPVTNWENRKLKVSYNGKGKAGYVDVSTGELIIAKKYDVALNFSNGVAFVKTEKKYALINKRGDIIVPAIINQPGKFIDGAAAVTIGRRTIKINAKGETQRNGQWIKLTEFLRVRTGN